LYDINEWKKLYNLNFMDFEKIFSPYINYWNAWKASPYRNKDVLPKSASFYKKRALAYKRPLFKIEAFS
jgi:hypothetical protein